MAKCLAIIPHFVHVVLLNRPVPTQSPSSVLGAIAVLSLGEYAWNGNARDLGNEMELGNENDGFEAHFGGIGSMGGSLMIL